MMAIVVCRNHNDSQSQAEASSQSNGASSERASERERASQPASERAREGQQRVNCFKAFYQFTQFAKFDLHFVYMPI